MAYTEQLFVKGQTLKAEQLNKMDAAIADIDKSVRDLKAADATLLACASYKIDFDEIVHAKMFGVKESYNTTAQHTDVANGAEYIFKPVENTSYYVTTSLQAASPFYPLIVYFDNSDNVIGYEYLNKENILYSITKQKLNIPDGTSYVIVNARKVEAELYTDIFGLKNVSTILKESAFDETRAGELYSCGNRDFVEGFASVSKGNAYVIYPKANLDYYVTTSLQAASPDFPLILYLDKNQSIIGYEYLNKENILYSIDKYKLNIPDGTQSIVVNARNATAQLYIMTDYVVDFTSGIEGKTDNEISILFVGNSLTQDGIAYLPYLLKTYYPEVKFRFYMWYRGGKTLADHYAGFTSGTTCDIFSVAENSPSWINSKAIMSDVLKKYRFDIVCMQEYFNYKESFTEENLIDWNNCKDYITANYKGGNPLKFITLLHAPKRDNADSIFAMTKSGNELILQKTIAEDMIPIGIAVYKALSTDLDSLGDSGHLSQDGTHTQEGLPCLIQTYTALCWLLDKLGINKSVYGCSLRMTTEIYNSINVPGANLGNGVVTGTNEQNLLGQEIAIQAYKAGRYIVGKTNDEINV